MVDKKYVFSFTAALAIFSMLFLHAGNLSSIRSTFAADGSTKAYVAPFYQVPGGSVIVSAEGLRPNATVTISAKNVVATVETEITGEPTKSVTFPDTVTVGTTVSNADGTLEWALGMPRDEVKVIERWINNSTGQEEVIKTVTTTYQFQGTVRIIVSDEYGNTADAELLVIRWIPRSPFG